MFLCPLLFLQIVIVLLAPGTTASEAGCSDAIKESNDLCKRWKRSELCDDKRVETVCMETCELCGDNAKREEENPEYKGCFQETSDSGFKIVYVRSRLSVRACVSTCRKRRYAYAGLQNARFCMCGDDYRSMPEVRKRDGCSKTCAGQGACGGFLEYSVYETAQSPSVKRTFDPDAVEELILGKQMVDQLKSRKKQKAKRVTKLIVPKKRNWNFELWLRKFVTRKHK